MQLYPLILKNSKVNVSHDRPLELQYTELPDRDAAQICGGNDDGVQKIPGIYKVTDVTLKRGTF